MRINLSRISFKAKLLFLVLASCFVLGAPTGTIALKEFVSSHTIFMESYRESLFRDFDIQAKSQVELATSILQGIYDRHQKGEFSLDEAKSMGADIVRKLRFGKDGYVWADTTEGVNVAMMGKVDVEGKSRINIQDVKGKYLIQEIIRNGSQPGGGYTDYWFPKPGADKPSPKRSYSLLFKPFGWVLGTGNYVDDLDAIVQKAADENHKRLRSSIIVILGVTLVVLIIIFGAATLFTRQLLTQIGAEPTELEQIAGRIAEGDLTVSMEEGRRGVYCAMQRMVVSLRQVMEKVNRTSQDLSRAAMELDGNSQSTAEGSQKVVGQAEMVATASEEMAATSSDIANSCHQAVESSDQANVAAQSGAAVVRDTVQGMGRIAEKVSRSAEAVKQLGTRSEQIGQIVGTIEDIADQTNLLALNAAIEAARAGEQGRGFAVVADEVRALAERTTKATREIGEMIKSIQGETKQAVKAMEEGVAEVEQGSVGAAKSGEALETILGQINDVTLQINQIATAAEEQTATTREITNNIHAISETVQVSAQSSMEISSSSSRLSTLSVELEEMVKGFKL